MTILRWGGRSFLFFLSANYNTLHYTFFYLVEFAPIGHNIIKCNYFKLTQNILHKFPWRHDPVAQI
jgi:hypothetical protein